MSPDLLGGGPAGPGGMAGPMPAGGPQAPPSMDPAMLLGQMMRRSGKKGPRGKHRRGKKKK